jgi:hypothetical protein
VPATAYATTTDGTTHQRPRSSSGC